MDPISSTDESPPATPPLIGLPSDAEQLALGQSGPLVRFASESVANLDKDLVLAIAEARQASIERTWSPATSARFWSAFNKLCEVIKPVTIDCLNALHKDIPRRIHLRFWVHTNNESLGERSSRRYTVALLWLLAVIVVLQLATWMHSNLGTALDTRASAVRAASESVRSKCNALSPKTFQVGDKPHEWTVDETTAFNIITREEEALNDQVVRLYSAGRFLAQVMHAGLGGHLEDYKPPSDSWPPSRSDWYDACGSYVKSANFASSLAAVTSERARLISGVLLQFVMPVLLGSIGALAYVLRNTSEQIKSSTFSTTSPVRNLVRIVLGALMGVVIGLFSDLSSKVNLQPLAIAFLAGYGVEPVFSLFDSLIAKLR
jgi:hypothetical protein